VFPSLAARRGRVQIGPGRSYVAPTSARAGRPFKSLLKPRLAHASARRIKPGLIFAPCLEEKALGRNGFSKKFWLRRGSNSVPFAFCRGAFLFRPICEGENFGGPNV
jgi:hypothetical protein